MRIAPTEGYFRACLAALESADGRVDDALREMERAEMLLVSGAPPAAVAALEVHRGHLDLMLARGADASRAATLVARAQQRLRDAELADRSEDVRFAVRLLTRALAGSAPAPRRAVLHVDADARAFRIGDQPAVDLTRRSALRHIVMALVEARGRPLAADELFAIGWPGEKVVGDAGGNRVRVAISTLRRLGLASVLLTSDAGYFLDTTVMISST
jgi:ATP/maltotriose-dependent transcriptional regulator MalT